MDYTNLYRTLVVGGAMLTGACATSGKQAASPEPATPSDAPQPEVETDAAQRGDETPGIESPESETPETEEGELACEEICEGGSGRERVCPDPQVGFDNCCWLMSDPHPCCEE